MEIVTCKAPVNIASIKYWGKRDEKLILPINDSISVTISTKLMNAKTTVAASPDFDGDRIWLNGREESISNPRLINCLKEIRDRVRSSPNPKTKHMLDWNIHICSENNFPTAAGLASSAAGYACLVYALGQLFQLEDDLSTVARRGSGSACRSIHGGFVHWEMGDRPDGSDSLAKQIAPASHWMEMKILILIVNSGKKSVGSSIAMQRSLQTSDYLKKMSGNMLQERVDQLTSAIINRDFEMFARITMKDSNRLHAVCLDTYPPVQYLNDTSHFIIQLVHFVNEYFGRTVAAYSFDAGPNACLFLLEQNVPLMLSIINYYLPRKSIDNGDPYIKGEYVEVHPPPNEFLNSVPLCPLPGDSLQGIIYSGVGDGPEILAEDEHLLNHSGLPVSLC